MLEKFSEMLGDVYSVIRAVLRLVFLTLAMFMSGLHICIFSRTEICNIELKGIPWRCDREKMDDQISFVDSLMSNNPDLLDFADDQMRNNGDLPPDIDPGEDS